MKLKLQLKIKVNITCYNCMWNCMWHWRWFVVHCLCMRQCVWCRSATSCL